MKSEMKAFTSSDPFSWLKNRCREMVQGESYKLAEGFHRVELPQQHTLVGRGQCRGMAVWFIRRLRAFF